MMTLLIAFGIALLSGLGVGGGGLFVIYLTLAADVPQLTAQGMNLLFFLFSASGAVAVHLFRRHIHGTAVLCMIVFAVLGALLGVSLSHALPNDILRKLFGTMLIITGVSALLKKKNK